MTINWKKEILTMAKVKEELYQVDKKKLWSWHLPEVAATESQINEIESHLCCPLDSQHKAFLKHSNGWESFYHDVDLFGIEELASGDKHNKAIELIEIVLESCPDEKFMLDEVFPIAVSKDDIDIFTINNSNSISPGIVSWFAGYRIDTFTNFEEYFMSMIEYNQLEIKSMFLAD